MDALYRAQTGASFRVDCIIFRVHSVEGLQAYAFS